MGVLGAHTETGTQSQGVTHSVNAQFYTVGELGAGTEKLLLVLPLVKSVIRSAYETMMS